MTRPRALRTLTVATLLCLLSGCGYSAQASPEELARRDVKVVATTGMVADVVRAVGGERVAVETLMGPGVDPHLYKASQGDVIRLAKADVVFYNGLHLEAKMADVFAEMPQKATVAVAEAVPERELLAPPEFEGQYDPHVWFDVSSWAHTVAAVEAALADLDPRHADLYARNAARYREELDELDDYVHRRVATLPAERRVLVTAHDAFNYFGRAYGFEVRGLQGISTVSEAGAADIRALAELIVAERVPAIFVESSVSPRTIRALQAAVRSRGFEVALGGELYSDALGPQGSGAADYIGMVRHNVDTIVAALGGDVPEA